MKPESQSDEQCGQSETEARQQLRTGRPLTEGTPVAGPTLTLSRGGLSTALLGKSAQPLVSDPASRTWATLLEKPNTGETDRPVLVQWVSPESPEPPVHYHPKTERFEALEGELTVVCDGTPIKLGPTESLTVEPGQEHTFRNDTSDIVAFKAELPSIQTVKGLYTAWGVSHERGRSANGSYGPPGPITSLLIAADLADETTITLAPQPVQRFLWATVGRLARLAGMTGIDERYLNRSFWERHVEQPKWEELRDGAN